MADRTGRRGARENGALKILVTGGAGFIGSAVCRYVIRETNATVINVDKLTYAGNLDSVAEIADDPRYRFEKVDICDELEVARVFHEHQPDAIMHLAAESHVDRSIDVPAAFIQTNIVGTYVLLEVARRYWEELEGAREASFRFHSVSTDEVYGSLGATGAFTEETPYRPNSPYAASKAASDHLVRAWTKTYGLPAVTSNSSNNYGPYQFPEKLIPLIIIKALAGQQLPVYGRGDNVRDWMHVEDHAAALWMVLREGVPGETYNTGGGNEVSNIDVVRRICALLDEMAPAADGRSHTERIAFVPDRPGHDKRYAIDATKISRELGWSPRESFDSGLRKTVRWYLDNRAWWQRILETQYRGERLGLGPDAAGATD